MMVQVSHTGTMDHGRRVLWPEGWPIPREGDSVTIPGLPEVTTVRTVVWYPAGDEDGDPEPFVYVVVGPAPPRNTR